jgi:hypothetical protein
MKKKGISGKPDNSYIENPHTIPFLLKRASVEITMMPGPVFSQQKTPFSLETRGFRCLGSYSFLFEKMKKDSDGNSHKISIKSFHRSIYVLKNFKSRKIEFSGIRSISPSK